LLPCLVFIVVFESKALLFKYSFNSKTTVCALTSCIPVTTTPLLPAALNSFAAALTALSIAPGKLAPPEELPVT